MAQRLMDNPDVQAPGGDGGRTSRGGGVRIRAAGKLNLSLVVLGRRGDGYHELDTVMGTVGLYDELLIRGWGRVWGAWGVEQESRRTGEQYRGRMPAARGDRVSVRGGRGAGGGGEPGGAGGGAVAGGG